MEMSPSQFREWMDYDAQHPFGSLREEIAFARIEALIVAAAGGDTVPLDRLMWSYVEPERPDPKAEYEKMRLGLDSIFGLAGAPRHGNDSSDP